MFTEEIERSDLDYFADTARSVEVVREENEQGRFSYLLTHGSLRRIVRWFVFDCLP